MDLRDREQVYQFGYNLGKEFIGEAIDRFDGNWSVTVYDVNPHIYRQYLQFQGTEEEVKAKILDVHLEMVKKNEQIKNDPAIELERIFERYDATSHYSDDHSVWAAGAADDRRIKELEAKIAPEVVATLRAKHAHRLEGVR